jgi:hypothetical protein
MGGPGSVPRTSPWPPGEPGWLDVRTGHDEVAFDVALVSVVIRASRLAFRLSAAFGVLETIPLHMPTGVAA